jgi:hypothetical protein
MFVCRAVTQQRLLHVCISRGFGPAADVQATLSSQLLTTDIAKPLIVLDKPQIGEAHVIW